MSPAELDKGLRNSAPGTLSVRPVAPHLARNSAVVGAALPEAPAVA